MCGNFWNISSYSFSTYGRKTLRKLKGTVSATAKYKHYSPPLATYLSFPHTYFNFSLVFNHHHSISDKEASLSCISSLSVQYRNSTNSYTNTFSSLSQEQNYIALTHDEQSMKLLPKLVYYSIWTTAFQKNYCMLVYIEKQHVHLKRTLCGICRTYSTCSCK